MALFGGDLGGYMTPDGRQVQMPAGLAAGFPSLRPVVPPPAVPGAGPLQNAPDSAPPDPMTALPLPSGGAQAWTPEDTATLAKQTPAGGGPITQPAQVPSGGPPSRPARAPVTSPAEATDAGPPNAASHKPMTEADMAKLGVAGPANAQIAAGDEKRAAIERQGTALADQATQVGNAQAAAEDRAQQLLEERQQEAMRRQAVIDEQTTAFEAQTKKIANTKIDRSADHPILAAIGIALATLGTAMQNRDNALAAAFRGQPAPAPIENPGLKAFYQGIDRKVAAQMADLDNQRAALSLQGQAIGMRREGMRDRLSEMDAYRNGYLEQAKMKIERIKQQSQSAVIKANADVMLADVSREQADTLGNAQARWQAHEDQVAARKQTAQFHGESMALQRRGQDMEQQRFFVNLAEQRQEKADALAEKMLERGDKASAEKAKQIGELGVVDPSTGDPMLSPAGQQKMAQADQFEAQARQSTDPAQAKKLTDQATALRQSAMVNDAAIATNKKAAEEAQKKAADAQEMINQTDLARRALQEGPNATNREAWAELTARLTFIKAQAAKGIGERVSVRAMEALDDVLSIDPESWTSRQIDKGKAIRALNTLDTEFAQSADVALRSAGIKSGWTPRKTADATKFEGQTADEVGQGAEPGILKKYLVNPLVHPVDTATERDYVGEATDSARLRTNPKGQASMYGLDPKDDDKIREIIKRSGSVGNAEYDRIVGQLAAPLAAQAEKRPTLVRGIVNLLKDENPKLFSDVMSRVQSSGGQVAAEQVASMIQKPVAGTPVPFGGNTPGLNRQLEEDRVRAKFNVQRPQQLPAMTPVADQPSPRLPPFFATLSPVAQQAYLNYLKQNGVNAGGPQ
jgi:hypothetical protein